LLGGERALVIGADVFPADHPSILLQSCTTCTGGGADLNEPAIADRTR
jgi:hypothetical protein